MISIPKRVEPILGALARRNWALLVPDPIHLSIVSTSSLFGQKAHYTGRIHKPEISDVLYSFG
jgi:hypothetical protein